MTSRAPCGRVLFAWGLGGALAVGAAGVASCSSFEESPAIEGGGEGGSDSPSGDAAAAPNDAGTDAAPAADAAKAIIRCGEEECVVGQEVCCLFELSAFDYVTFCAEGTCPPSRQNDAGAPYVRHSFACDDSSDCPVAGNVCCLLGNAACGAPGYTGSECRTRAACPRCAADGGSGGVGYEGCRPTIASDCPPSTACSGTAKNLPQYSFAYCE